MPHRRGLFLQTSHVLWSVSDMPMSRAETDEPINVFLWTDSCGPTTHLCTTPSLHHPRLKTYLYIKSFPPQNVFLSYFSLRGLWTFTVSSFIPPPILQMRPEAICFRAVRSSVRACVYAVECILLPASCRPLVVSKFF